MLENGGRGTQMESGWLMPICPASSVSAPPVGRQDEEWLEEVLVHLDPIREPGGFPGISDGKGFACSEGGLDSIPGLGRSPGEGTGYPL